MKKKGLAAVLRRGRGRAAARAGAHLLDWGSAPLPPRCRMRSSKKVRLFPLLKWLANTEQPNSGESYVVVKPGVSVYAQSTTDFTPDRVQPTADFPADLPKSRPSDDAQQPTADLPKSQPSDDAQPTTDLLKSGGIIRSPETCCWNGCETSIDGMYLMFCRFRRRWSSLWACWEQSRLRIVVSSARLYRLEYSS